MANPYKILIIVTCFNRKNLTIKFLESLMGCKLDNDVSIHIYLMDDKSPDNTGDFVKQNFPDVNVLYGDGSLYWAGGVKLILANIGEKLSTFDAVLFANDDIEFHENALMTLYRISKSNNAIVGGTVLTRSGLVESSGSRLGWICKPRVRLVIANGNIQNCQLLPGHILFVPTEIFVRLGLDPKLRFRFIDLEFTLRASRKGIPVLLAPEPLAITNDLHDYFLETSSMRGSFKELVGSILLDPKGPHWRESAYYLRKVSPFLWWVWLPLFYRAFILAVAMSQLEKTKTFYKQLIR